MNVPVPLFTALAEVTPKAASRALRMIPAIEEAMQDADLLKITTVTRRATLPSFVLHRYGHSPRLKSLLGRTTPAFPALLAPGGSVGTFTTIESDPDYFWLAESSSSFRTRYAAVVAEPGPEGQPLFHCATILHFHHWSMPLYHQFISPMQRLAGRVLHRH